jgi:phage I-like protein
MDQQFGWWVDLQKVVLTDTATGASTWIHALPFGEYQHPAYGKMVFDQAKLTALAMSVNNKVRGIDPDIDYDHKTDPAKGHQAAGWVKAAQVRDNGLFLHVDFTKDATQEIKDKKYRYFSADFHDKWKDPNGTEHTDVLAGGGLTNRPYMKNLLPVNLSELSFSDPPEEEDEVDGKKLRAALQLAETITDEEVFTKLGELVAGVTKLTDDNKKLTDEIAKLKTPEPEVDPELKKLIEGSPAFAKMYEAWQAKEKQLAEAQTALRLAEVNGKLAEIQNGKTFALAPVIKDDVRDILVKSDPEAAKKLYELLEKLVDGSAVVDLSERGYSGRRELDGGDTVRRFNEAVKALMEADKNLDYGSAVEAVAKEKPQLFSEYREQSYQFKS